MCHPQKEDATPSTYCCRSSHLKNPRYNHLLLIFIGDNESPCEDAKQNPPPSFCRKSTSPKNIYKEISIDISISFFHI